MSIPSRLPDTNVYETQSGVPQGQPMTMEAMFQSFVMFMKSTGMGACDLCSWIVCMPVLQLLLLCRNASATNAGPCSWIPVSDVCVTSSGSWSTLLHASAYVACTCLHTTTAAPNAGYDGACCKSWRQWWQWGLTPANRSHPAQPDCAVCWSHCRSWTHCGQHCTGRVTRRGTRA